MEIWPLVLVALVAGFFGLFELTDFGWLFHDPAREAFSELVSWYQERRDIDVELEIEGLGVETSRVRVQVLPGEEAVRFEVLAPEDLSGHIYTYRRGILVHYRPGNGGTRFVFTLDEGELPRVRFDPQRLRFELEQEVLGEGSPDIPQPPLTLPSPADVEHPEPGVGIAPPPVPPLPGPKKLTITGFPDPLKEIVIWYEEPDDLRSISVAWGKFRVTFRILGMRFDTGVSLNELLALPHAERTLWYRGGQSM